MRKALKWHYLVVVGAKPFPANQNVKYECFHWASKYSILLAGSVCGTRERGIKIFFIYPNQVNEFLPVYQSSPELIISYIFTTMEFQSQLSLKICKTNCTPLNKAIEFGFPIQFLPVMNILLSSGFSPQGAPLQPPLLQIRSYHARFSFLPGRLVAVIGELWHQKWGSQAAISNCIP